MRRLAGGRRIGGAAVGLLGLLLWLGAITAMADTPTKISYTTPGIHMFTVPAGVSSMVVGAVGAVGGGCNGVVGGDGDAVITSSTPVLPGEQLFVGVGAPGSNCAAGGMGGTGGGGAGGTATSTSSTCGESSDPGVDGGGGGGASLVGLASPSPGFSDLLVVAGGGGGAGGGGDCSELGGAGGNAESRGANGHPATGGGAGSASAGGAGGTGDVAGHLGSFGLGGAGATAVYNGGGGGGGGYYGGGSGAGDDGADGAGGGGGGSTFVIPGATIALGPAPVGPFPESEPAVVLEYEAPPAEGTGPGVTGPQGPAGAIGPAGAPGATGAQGPSGTNGATGPAGASGTNGEIELVTCTDVKAKVGKRTVTQKKCTTKLTSSPVSFTTSAASASISRAGHVYATGSLSNGKLLLRTSKVLRAGRYTLKLTSGTDKHTRTTKQTITLE